MPNQFEEVVLDNIGQGRFKADCNAALTEVQAALIAHIAEHGEDRDAAAGLTMKVAIKYSKGVIAIVTDVDKKLPKNPAAVSSAFIGDNTETGEKTLFCQRGGTHTGNSKQAVMCDVEGDPIT